jgi:hypothetical protein
MKNYRSSIPKAAHERVVATWISGPQKFRSNYSVAGFRQFHETGELTDERPLKNRVLHGIVYRSLIPGKLLSAEPYVKGKLRGTARQWPNDEKLIARTRWSTGTGIDLWWCDHDGFAHLSEARYVKEGKWHGFEWWLNEDQKSVMVERHFRQDHGHGIERWWNLNRKLRRGYPMILDSRPARQQAAVSSWVAAADVSAGGCAIL